MKTTNATKTNQITHKITYNSHTEHMHKKASAKHSKNINKTNKKQHIHNT